MRNDDVRIDRYSMRHQPNNNHLRRYASIDLRQNLVHIDTLPGRARADDVTFPAGELNGFIFRFRFPSRGFSCLNSFLST
jgi:hypothetical protein